MEPVMQSNSTPPGQILPGHPDCCFCHAPLIFAGMLPNEEGEIFALGELKVRPEDRLERIESVHCLPIPLKSTEPIHTGRIFREPGVRRGDDKLSTRANKRVDLVKKCSGARQAVDEICQQHRVKLAKVGTQFLCVSLLETHACSIDLRGKESGRLPPQFSFFDIGIQKRSFFCDSSSGFNETMRL